MTEQAQTTTNPPPAEEKKPAPKLYQARVLVDCQHGKCNDVAELEKAALEEAEKAGLVDGNKAAVAYALSLRKAQD